VVFAIEFVLLYLTKMYSHTYYTFILKANRVSKQPWHILGTKFLILGGTFKRHILDQNHGLCKWDVSTKLCTRSMYILLIEYKLFFTTFQINQPSDNWSRRDVGWYVIAKHLFDYSEVPTFRWLVEKTTNNIVSDKMCALYVTNYALIIQKAQFIKDMDKHTSPNTPTCTTSNIKAKTQNTSPNEARITSNIWCEISPRRKVLQLKDSRHHWV